MKVTRIVNRGERCINLKENENLIFVLFKALKRENLSKTLPVKYVKVFDHFVYKKGN